MPETKRSDAAPAAPAIGIVTDEVSPDLADALGWCQAHGLSRVELRVTERGRFPEFSEEELHLLEASVQAGALAVTAVSPGLFKGAVEDAGRLEHELEEVLPRVLDVAAERLACRRVIAFGFPRQGGGASERARAMQAFEQAAERCRDAGAELLIENEPNFWVDRPEDEAQLLEEIGHPALGANWDPANAVWGGADLAATNLDRLAPFIQNLHVKDYVPHDRETPWRPVGQGVMPWPRLLRWIAEATALDHVVLETHCAPLKANSRESLRALRDMLGQPSLASSAR